MKRCPLCAGPLVRKRVTHPQEHEGRIIILENVPAEVCRQCNEILIRPDVLERIQAIVWSNKSPERTAEVPVYDLAQIS